MKKLLLPVLICLMLLLSNGVMAAKTVTIISQPKDSSGQIGDTLSFEITANGEGILNYIWYLKVEDSASGELLEETELGYGSSASLTLTSKMIDESKRNYVYCLVSDSSGDIVTSTAARVTLSSKGTDEPIKVVYQPGGEISCRVGDEVMVSAAVTIPEDKLGTLTYRWYRSSDTSPIRLEGENKPYLMIPTNSAGIFCYYCIVTNELDGVLMQSDASELVYVKVEGGNAMAFEDVSDDAWYYQAVKKAAENGLFNGRTSKLFAPNESITIAEAITLACRIDKMPSVTLDGSEKLWYSPYIEYALEHEIIDSEPGALAGSAITRGYFAELLAAVLDDELTETVEVKDGSITDVAADSEYAESIYKLYRCGILTGYEDGSFCPDSTITRAEAAAALARIYQ